MHLTRPFVVLISLFATTIAAYQNTLDSSADATSKRLQPPARVVVDGAAQQQPTKSSALAEPGQAVYQKYCSVCHAQGIAGAPKTGDQNSWQRRVDQGWPTLMKHAISGYKGMPAKGHCMKCSEHDIEEAVEYMLKGTGLDESRP